MISYDDVKPPFDAVAFVAFDDEAAWRNAANSAEFQNALGDAPNFQQTEETYAFNAREYVIV